MALWGAGFCPVHPPRLNLSGTGYPCRCGTRRGRGGFGRPPAFYFSFVFSPIPPPPFPAGRGRLYVYFAGGFAPGTPATGWGAALAPLSASGHFTVKAKESVFLWTVPAAKERGDRGRGTSAFEMVLSPGAGITSAVGGTLPRRPSERHLTRPALLFPFPPTQCGRDRPAPCAFPQHPGRKEWWSGHG